MNFQDMLRLVVTLLGGAFSILSFVVIFKGKRVGGDGKKKNVIKFKDIELQANSVLMLVIVSMIVCILPLLLPYVSRGPTTDQWNEVPLDISGIVQNENQKGVQNVSVEYLKKDINGKEIVFDSTLTDSQGYFFFKDRLFNMDDRVYLEVKYPTKKITQRQTIIPINHIITINTESEWADN